MECNDLKDFFDDSEAIRNNFLKQFVIISEIIGDL